MTGLFNHKRSYELLAQEIERSGRYGHHCSILMMDIDHFKAVNDTYGHKEGDRVIIGIAGIIRECSRTTDFTGRYGGEEFIVIMPETKENEAWDFAERLRLTIEKNDFGKPSPITVSGGVKSCSSGSAGELVEACDKLLYQAKRNGRNRIERPDKMNP